ncbi:hypothetical protein [Flavobacterium sp. 7A]|uniref:hypothetical protein n=1 Tax=Flavobacterium sp. 7A TaxID=2940571 RepID=UPI00222770D5|nr:hypothetical protein [Flavobacterium sp. 7A]MCW2119607.1 hypothetical protein [Flavobacterium sp. 7A]
MKKNTLDDYKKAIKAQYKLAIQEENSSLLLNPSRAKLRNLCFEIFKDVSNKDDLMSFASFCGFEFNPTAFNKLKDLTDKFRPIETFFKGETELTDIEALNIAAILVDYQARPFLRFMKKEKELKEDHSEEDMVFLKDKKEVLDNKVSTTLNEIKSIENRGTSTFYKLIGSTVLLSSLICGVVFFFLSQEQCMQWKGDHYEIVECKEDASFGIVTIETKVPLNKNMLKFRKITVCDTTTFFKDHKAIVWYCKNGKKVEFFNNPGFNPDNDRPLKAITQYMIDKYVVNK